jgi:hypothetical protein
VAGGKQPADGPATLVVSPPSGTDQTQATTSADSQTEETARFGSDGAVRLTFLHLENQAFDVSFHFASPEVILPAGARAGMTYSWTAKSDDGKTTLAYTGSVKGTETVTVGGTAVRCVVIQSTLALSGGTNLRVTQTDDYSPDNRLIVREHQIASGSFGPLPFTADITTTLDRLTPR